MSPSLSSVEEGGVDCVFAPGALLLVVGKRWSPALVDPILSTGECMLEIQQLTRAGTVGQCKTNGSGLVQIILRKDSPINEVVNRTSSKKAL